MTIDFSNFDFLDFGASKGGSIDFARTRLGGGRGLGIDIDAEKVAEMRAAGHDCLQDDITSLEVPDDAVRFVIISHLLEHLPSLELVEATLRSAARTATDFIYIQGPVFDADEYLESLGLKVYWTDWHGHPCHLTTSQLRAALEKLGLTDFVMMANTPIRSSDDPAIHPLSSPQDQHDYDPAIHPPKPSRIHFEDRELYREFICCVRLRPFPGWSSMVESVRRTKRATVLDSSYAVEPATPRLEPPWRRDDRLDETHRRLLRDRGWDFLSYLHLRTALYRAEGVRRVLTTNRRRGYQELALGIEFPQLQIHFQPPADCSPGRYDLLRDLLDRWSLDNVSVGAPGTPPPTGGFDLAAATECFDGSDSDARLADSLRQWSTGWVWVLTGYSPHTSTAWRGYGTEELTGLVGPGDVQGCYWLDAGHALREKLRALSDEQIDGSFRQLRSEAVADLGGGPPIPGASVALHLITRVLNFRG